MSKFVSIGSFAVGVLVLLYIGACVLLYAMQETLIFHPLKTNADLAKGWANRRVEIPGAASAIEGWWADNPSSKTDAVIIYFGGNGEDVLYAASAAHQLDARQLLATNYRGYGGRLGKPTQKGILEDALAVYDYAVHQPNVTANNIVVMGRSLGTGVATYIAANRPVRGVVLITPYDSIESVAKELFPWMPVNLLLQHKFPSDQYAKNIHRPVTILAARNDQVIPSAHAQRLFEAWVGAKEIHVLDNVGHNDIERHPDYYKTINDFLGRSDATISP